MIDVEALEAEFCKLVRMDTVSDAQRDQAHDVARELMNHYGKGLHMMPDRIEVECVWHAGSNADIRMCDATMAELHAAAGKCGNHAQEMNRVVAWEKLYDAHCASVYAPYNVPLADGRVMHASRCTDAELDWYIREHNWRNTGRTQEVRAEQKGRLVKKNAPDWTSCSAQVDAVTGDLDSFEAETDKCKVVYHPPTKLNIDWEGRIFFSLSPVPMDAINYILRRTIPHELQAELRTEQQRRNAAPYMTTAGGPGHVWDDYTPEVDRDTVPVGEPECVCANVSMGHSPDCAWKKWKDAQ